MNEPAVPSLRSNRAFISYMIARAASILGVQLMAVSVAWQVYSLSPKGMSLALVGLVQFVPMLLFTLPSGVLADRADRRKILMTAHGLVGTIAFGLSEVTSRGLGLSPIYALLCCFGLARALAAPAGTAIVPSLVPKEMLSRAVATGSTVFEVALFSGPALAGFLYAQIGPANVYRLTAVLQVIAVLCVSTLPSLIERAEGKESVLDRVKEGLRFIRSHKIILGAISLDLFAVLFGGAVALMPMFAAEVLHVGETGLGILRAAPSVGSVAMAFFLSRYPIRKHAGRYLFAGVAMFGFATIAFGLSQSLPLSLFFLAVLGASDMISVVVRQTVSQISTPANMRGRVGAVSMLFVSASNELGEFESGLSAELLGGPREAAIFGGCATLVVVMLWMLLFPKLRKLDNLQAESV